MLAAAIHEDGRPRGFLVITWDEGNIADTANGGGRIATVIVGSKVRAGYRSSTMAQHEATLRMMLEGLGITNLPAASASAPSFAEFFQP